MEEAGRPGWAGGLRDTWASSAACGRLSATGNNQPVNPLSCTSRPEAWPRRARCYCRPQGRCWLEVPGVLLWMHFSQPDGRGQQREERGRGRGPQLPEAGSRGSYTHVGHCLDPQGPVSYLRLSDRYWWWSMCNALNWIPKADTYHPACVLFFHWCYNRGVIGRNINGNKRPLKLCLGPFCHPVES